MQNEDVIQIWNATWVFNLKDGTTVSTQMCTPMWHYNLYHLLDIGYYVNKAANGACRDYKDCLNQITGLKSIHYDKFIGESILNKYEFLEQHGIRIERDTTEDTTAQWADTQTDTGSGKANWENAYPGDDDF